MRWSRIVPLVAVVACAPATDRDGAAAPIQVRLGTDVIADQLPDALAGKRVGLITNHTGQDGSRTPTIDVLATLEGLELVALFAPEHGIRGEGSGRIDDAVDTKTGLPVLSLYGETRKPTPEMLEGIEALVFDIQDVGVRQYTYLSTMALAMQAAAEQDIPFVVLDRPNPIGGHIVEGNLLDPAFSSFVGMYPIASRHGMTAGELARMYNDEFGIGAQLTVVPLEGWRRNTWFDQTNLPWTGPSPNLPEFSGTIHYPGTVFFEGTNLSEGRGTDAPFEQTGAPWLHNRDVADAMNALQLPGVRFEAIDVTTRDGARKYGGLTIPGVRYILTDREAYRPIATTLRLIDVVRHLQPDEFEWRRSGTGEEARFSLDRLTGTDRVRLAIDAGTLDELLEAWERDAARFEAMRQPYLLY